MLKLSDRLSESKSNVSGVSTGPKYYPHKYKSEVYSLDIIRPNKSIVSTPHFIDYSDDADASRRIIANYERWNSDKKIYELMTQPELFASFCSARSLEAPDAIISNSNAQRDFEIFRCDIADDILAKEKNFQLYVNSLEHVWPEILEEICKIAGINFSQTTERHQLKFDGCFEVLMVKYILNFEWINAANPADNDASISAYGVKKNSTNKKGGFELPDNQIDDSSAGAAGINDKNSITSVTKHVASLKEIMESPEQFRAFVDDICAPLLDPQTYPDREIEEFRELFRSSILEVENFKVFMIPTGKPAGKYNILKKENHPNPLYWICKTEMRWDFGNIEAILNRICERSGRTLDKITYDNGLVVFNLMTKPDPAFKNFQLPATTYQNLCRLGYSVFPQNLYEDYLKGNYCDFDVFTGDGRIITMHSVVYNDRNRHRPGATRATFRENYDKIKSYVDSMYLLEDEEFYKLKWTNFPGL